MLYLDIIYHVYDDHSYGGAVAGRPAVEPLPAQRRARLQERAALELEGGSGQGDDELHAEGRGLFEAYKAYLKPY